MKTLLIVALFGFLALSSAMPKHSSSSSSSSSSSRSSSKSSGSSSSSREKDSNSSEEPVSGVEEPVTSVEEPAPGGDEPTPGGDEPAPSEEEPSGDDDYKYLTIHESLVLEPEDPPKELISMNYPSEAPADLRQSWSILTYSPDYPTKLQITCEDFNLPESDPCRDFELIIDEPENNERSNFCGEKKDFTFTSKFDGAVILLATGPQGGGKMKCQATAIKAE